jgi:hypothetical protein
MASNNFVFKSETQLGDCLLQAHFMRKAVEKYPNIIFNFHLIDKHWDQTKEYIEDIPQINLLPYSTVPDKHLRGWVGQFGIPQLPCPLDGLRLNSYKLLCEKKMGIESPFKTVEDLLYDNPKLKDGYDTKQFDIVLVNSDGQSNQTSSNNEEDYEIFIKKAYNKGLSVITTKKLKDYPCTSDYNLSVMGIGALSIKSKAIVGVGTGAIQCCLNIWNKDKRFLYIDQHHYFHLPNIKMISSVNQIEI